MAWRLRSMMRVPGVMAPGRELLTNFHLNGGSVHTQFRNMNSARPLEFGRRCNPLFDGIFGTVWPSLSAPCKISHHPIELAR